MTGRRPARRRSRRVSVPLAAWAAAGGAVALIVALRFPGYVIVTAATGVAGYLLGRHGRKPARKPQPAAPRPARTPQGSTAASGQPKPATAVTGPSAAALRREVTAGLVSLGWTARDVRPAVDTALADPAVPRETPAVLRAVLAAHAATLGSQS